MEDMLSGWRSIFYRAQAQRGFRPLDRQHSLSFPQRAGQSLQIRLLVEIERDSFVRSSD
jgi:hypothetical protein